MHYIKCDVNSSLLTQFWLLQKVCGTLDHCFISRHTVFTKRAIYKFTLVWHSVKQGTTHRPTSHLAHLYTVPFLWLQEYRWHSGWVDDFTGQRLLWWLSSCKTFFAPALGLLTNLGVGWSWPFPALSIKFLTRRSLKSRWVYLVPHEDNIIQLLGIANNYNDLPYLSSSIWLAQFHKPDATEIWSLLQWQQNRSKATMWLLHNVPAFRGCPRRF